jgi:hypothetical protein
VQARLQSDRGPDASEAADVDHWQVVRRRLDRVAVVMGLHEFGPGGRRASGRRERWRFEGFAEIREDLPDRGRVSDERDEPDVTAAGAEPKRWRKETAPSRGRTDGRAAASGDGHCSAEPPLNVVEEDPREGGDGYGPVGEDAPQSLRH